jgi:hypothetical protein
MRMLVRFPHRNRRALPVIATLALAAAIGVVVHAHHEFSLDTAFQSFWNRETASCVDADGPTGDGICGDGRGPYYDLTDGVDSWSNSYGNIQLVTSNSPSRSICLDFPEHPTHTFDEAYRVRFVGDDANVLDGCYRGAFNTLANADYGATDVGVVAGVPNPSPISAWIYFFVNGLQYELHWKRQGFNGYDDTAPPLKVTYDSNAWFLSPFDHPGGEGFDSCPNCLYTDPCPENCATLVVFSDKQPRGRVLVANYVMPFGLMAVTAEQNKRAKGGKGKK